MSYDLQSQVEHFMKTLRLTEEFYLGNISGHNIWSPGRDGISSSVSGSLVRIMQ
jgi:hypothetical protein